MDLNINNYSFEDLLKLFKLPHNYTKENMLGVKKLLLKYHPDKGSKLPKECFIFLKEAYNVLLHLIEPRFEDDVEMDTQVLKEFFQNEKISDFNSWFNQHFEKLEIEKTHGYEDWLRRDKTPTCRSEEDLAVICFQI
jgi:DnaJ-class molecular chaperone